jgi:hypothetical protein
MLFIMFWISTINRFAVCEFIAMPAINSINIHPAIVSIMSLGTGGRNIIAIEIPAANPKEQIMTILRSFVNILIKKSNIELMMQQYTSASRMRVNIIICDLGFIAIHTKPIISPISTDVEKAEVGVFEIGIFLFLDVGFSFLRALCFDKILTNTKAKNTINTPEKTILIEVSRKSATLFPNTPRRNDSPISVPSKNRCLLFIGSFIFLLRTDFFTCIQLG